MSRAGYQPPAPNSKIIIVGAGAFGLSTAYALSLKNKYDIWVFERQCIPSPDAASCDINKIMRMDYGKELMYMHMYMESLPMWEQWNKERAAKGRSPVFHNSIREAGYGHLIEEFRTPEAIAERYPQFKEATKNGFNIAYLNKAGGWCDSSEACTHIHEKCVENGVHFVAGPEQGSFVKFQHDEKISTKITGIETKDGKLHTADLVIMATGSWTPGLVDSDKRLVATGQTVIQFKIPEPMRKMFECQPTWCADLSVTGFYGFAVNHEGKMKIGYHSSGFVNLRDDKVSVPRTQVTHPTDSIPAPSISQFRKFLSKFLPVTTPLDISCARVCWYCDSVDGHYLIAPHPEYDNLIIASGDSGHGMKFIPNLGFKICHVIECVDSEYSRAWAWRDMPKDATYDGLRADSGPKVHLDLNVEDEYTRMAKDADLKAIKSSL
ncbi:FAD dependent oxidoreductase [Zychaea mexicana]|uniref:FAD dependent oxidoreductase n=1 Tax=Zychaea mexicana TaxID=64656 RepID=UPI0022FE4FD2|nr:FAD dependent oxidoreductase [Zychaea mexicana]KAI9491665.1 FAD dependent oxidoreductase [Zychaea mexicana]